MLFWLSCLLAGLSLHCLVWVAVRPARHGRPAPDHVHHWMLRLAWPWLEVCSAVVAPWLSWRVRALLQRSIGQAGLDEAWQPEHLAAAQLLSCLVGAAVGAGTAILLDLDGAALLGLAVLGAATAAWWPWHVLASMGMRRRLHMQREFPFLLDMATLCVEAGLSLQGALQEAANHGPHGPLRDELRRALADMRAGMVRSEALQHWGRRSGLPAVQQLVAALGQADHLGMSLGPLLRAQSEQRRNERFLRAEKLALQAPVKMLFPLVCCIFPCTFLIIGFPIAVKLLEAM